MRNVLIAIAFAPLVWATAQAADLPARVYTKAPPAQPAYSWNGFYVGANVGYAFNDPTVSFTPGDPLFAFLNQPAATAYDVKGVIGGGQIGYNWQFDRNWLFGLEADFNGADIKGTGTSAFLSGGVGGNPASVTATQNVDWFGTFRARLGWLPSDKLLVYGTGGFAYGSVKENVIYSQPGGGGGVGLGFSFACAPPNNNVCFAGSSSTIATGYTAGAGIEYAAWQNFTFKVEYLYVNLGTTSTRSVAIVGAPPSSFFANFSDLDFNVVRIGANYRF
ncbi:MAG: porin family protein [Afipia sp.]|nr:porin family protein [Afipia sp.]